MILLAGLVLAALAQGTESRPVDAAGRIAACGPSAGDRVLLEAQLRSAAYDHVGGGFHDFPGGPKRLETNAWYLNALVAAHETQPDLFVRNMALDISAFVLRDLKDAAGGFFSSIGAVDTTSYYAFSEPELRSALGPDKSREFFASFALAPGGFPQLTGSPFAGLADTRQTLLLRRLRRVRLPLDDTIDPDSNGLWVGALARAAFVLGRHDFMEAAGRGAAAVSRPQGRAGAGVAFGLVSLERFGGEPDTAASSRALDRAIEKSPNLSPRDLMTLAWALADTVRLRPSDLRRRQLTALLGAIESRFALTEAAAAARCAVSTVPAKVP